MKVKRRRTVEPAASVGRRRRVVSALVAPALLALTLIGSLPAFAPGASAQETLTLEASSQEPASHEPASVDSLSNIKLARASEIFSFLG